ncbi:MAG: Uma2 family endonuclease [Lewinella sp.]|nr:Uma2 family endonuclease [Lewinella sp.]
METEAQQILKGRFTEEEYFEQPQPDETKGIARTTNSCLTIEVLSETTADYDRGGKFRAYRQLESFKEYLLIDSRKLLVDYFYQEVKIRTPRLTLPVSAFYEGLNFPPETEER